MSACITNQLTTPPAGSDAAKLRQLLRRYVLAKAIGFK